jgi:hypothetical protein
MLFRHVLLYFERGIPHPDYELLGYATLAVRAACGDLTKDTAQ